MNIKDFGFVRVAAASPAVKVADVDYNVSQIISFMEQAEEAGVSLLALPELSVTGYTCGDLFGNSLLLDAAEKGIAAIRDKSAGKRVTVVVGTPLRYCGRLYNCAAVIKNGSVRGLVPKIYLPSYNEFYESRWFSSGSDFLSKTIDASGEFMDNGKDFFRKGSMPSVVFAGKRVTISPNQLFTIGKTTFAIEICEDLWTPLPPSSFHAVAGAEIIVNLSASNEVLMKHQYRKSLVSNQSARTISAYVYSSCGWGESTQDLVFAGSSMICENGSLIAESERFSREGKMIVADIDVEKLSALRRKQSTFYTVSPDGTNGTDYNARYSRVELGAGAKTDFEKSLLRYVEPHPFVPGGDPGEIDRRATEIIGIQVQGLATRLSHIRASKAVIGISGGLDSTLALIVAVLAFDFLGLDRKGIIGITMPGFGTTDRTHDNAVDLMSALGVTSREISIAPAVTQHFRDIEQDPSVHDVTYENSQARERTQLLMDIANKENAIVVGTGDLSELALGWCTYNGDHMSMYAVNAGVPKTLVKYLVRWAAMHRFDSVAVEGVRPVKEILLDIIDTPISPELTPADENGNIAQKTEDLVGPYELHDFFLYNFFRFGYAPDKLFFLARKAFCGERKSGTFEGQECKETQYDEDTIRKWLKTFCRRFFNQQFKRSCLPDGPKVGSVSLSPRGDWRMPSDASSALWTGMDF